MGFIGGENLGSGWIQGGCSVLFDPSNARSGVVVVSGSGRWVALFFRLWEFCP